MIVGMQGGEDFADAPAAWRGLGDELDRWAAAGRVATLWWRDDDAIAPTPQLERLLALTAEVPLALAVVPAAAQPELAALLRGRLQVSVVQHGWRHVNHADDGKKSEFPAGRDRAAVSAELMAGRKRLRELFRDQALPVLAPPWNRIDNGFLPLVAEAGLCAVSRRAPRPPPEMVEEIDIHADLVAWRGDRGFVGEPAVLGAIVGHAKARRCGGAAMDEPTGILTHHLVQDRATEAFLVQLLAAISAHPAARWLGLRDRLSAQ